MIFVFFCWCTFRFYIRVGYTKNGTKRTKSELPKNFINTFVLIIYFFAR